MLKIKDDVDLKELKNFGFENEVFSYLINVCKNKKTALDGFRIDKENRRIHNYAVEDDTLDILYDLIQAGLVEKVSD